MDGADYAPEGVKVMPDGPGLPDTGIQRGTLKDADGDPSTYLYPSSSNNQRIIIYHNIYYMVIALENSQCLRVASNYRLGFVLWNLD